MKNPVPETFQYWPQQSPIDLTGALPVKFSRDYLRIKYPAKVIGEFINDPPPDNYGFNLVLKPDSKAYIFLDDQRCRLKKLHFHHQSEHLIDGKRFPLEIHLVHEIETPRYGSKYAVIGVFLKDKAKAKTPKSLLALADFLSLPAIQNYLLMVSNRETSKPPTGDIAFNPNHCLPEDREFFRYEGSLTTPDFAETVSWVVYRNPIEIAGDVEIIKKNADHEARQPQSLARRFLLRSV
jgi:carbonic anhydrase